MDRDKHPAPDESTPPEATPNRDLEATDAETDAPGYASPNPPRTTKGKMTAPKFGSAGSGGAELEPGPERD